MSHRLVYTSHTTRPLSADDLQEILGSAALANSQDHITGLLIYCRDSFMQLLEGPERSVRRAMARVVLSSRHHDIRILTDTSTSDEPMFPHWAMGYWVPGLAPFGKIDAPLTDSRFIPDWNAAHDIFLRYKRGDFSGSAA